MGKPVDPVQAFNQLLTNGLPQCGLDLLPRGPENDRQHRNLSDGAETGQKLQRPLRFGRQARQLPDHEVHHIVGVALGANALELPRPARDIMIKRQQVLLGERMKKLNDKERVASRLLVHQLCQPSSPPRRAAKRIRDQLPDVFMGQRRERDLRDLSAFALDGFELAHQRMRSINLVLPVGADQQQVPDVRLGQKIVEEIECCCVEPLQIVEEQCQRMVRPREHADEPPDHQLETPLRVLWREFGDRRLFTDDKVEFGDEVDHEPCVRAQRLQQRFAPARHLALALAEQRAHQALKRLH